MPPLRTPSFPHATSPQFSNHTGYPVVRGTKMEPPQLAALLEGLRDNGLLGHTHLLTGVCVCGEGAGGGGGERGEGGRKAVAAGKGRHVLSTLPQCVHRWYPLPACRSPCGPHWPRNQSA